MTITTRDWIASYVGGKIGKLTIIVASNASLPNRVTAVLEFGKPGQLTETRFEKMDPAKNCQTLVEIAHQELGERLIQTYTGSGQPLEEIINFVDECFDDFECES
jgi:hypothetical protein